jgi:ferredoxin
MSSEKCRVTILAQGAEKQYLVRKGLGFQALAAGEPIAIEFDCRKADCGICAVRVIHGKEHLSQPDPVEADFLRAMRADSDERLACQCRIYGPVVVEAEDV